MRITLTILAVLLFIGIIVIPPTYVEACNEAVRELESTEIPMVAFGYIILKELVDPQVEPCSTTVGLMWLPAYAIIVIVGVFGIRRFFTRNY